MHEDENILFLDKGISIPLNVYENYMWAWEMTRKTRYLTLRDCCKQRYSVMLHLFCKAAKIREDYESLAISVYVEVSMSKCLRRTSLFLPP